jgi:hypothetical protein
MAVVGVNTNNGGWPIFTSLIPAAGGGFLLS